MHPPIRVPDAIPSPDLPELCTLYVCELGFVHVETLGLVLCPVCGREAHSRSEIGISAWERAHVACCRKRRLPAAA
jgi:hypothetical protein